MPSFNGLSASLSLVGLLALPLSADELTMADGSARLSGTVNSISENGTIALASPLSPDPLLIKSDAVERVAFSAPAAAEPAATALVELTNGDLFPATLEALDHENLTITSPDAGRIIIPRQHLSSLQLGIRTQKILYSGPRNMEEWSHNGNGPENWTFANDRLVATGQASASMDAGLPEQFTLRFTLEWPAKQIPNFQIYFADPLKDKGEPTDRYYLRFSGAGLDIKRESSEGKRHHDIQVFNRTPGQYADRTLQVEVRVDRHRGRLHLFLNGEPEGTFEDPVRNIPEGTGICLTSTAGGDNRISVRNLEILEFNESHGRHTAEDRGDPAADSLISVDDDRWSGRLIQIVPATEGSTFRFKSNFQDEPLEIGQSEVSTVFFATKHATPAAKAEHPFVLRLRGDGRLRVASCQFANDVVTAIHPLLGNISFRRDGVVALERSSTDPATNPPEP